MRTCTVLLVQDLKKEIQRPKIIAIINRAEKDYYHDFFGTPDMPEMQLIADLREAGASNQIIQNVVNGKYDASKEDSEEWSKSPEGQETFANLITNKFLPPGLRKKD